MKIKEIIIMKNTMNNTNKATERNMMKDYFARKYANKAAENKYSEIIADTKVTNVLSNTKVVKVTEEVFLDSAMSYYGELFKADKNFNVGQITISSNNYNAITLLRYAHEKQFKVLANKCIMTVLNTVPGIGEGTGKYDGLAVRQLKIDNVDLDLVNISEEEELMVIESIAACDLEDVDNLYQILIDLNSLFRFYQEMTIDAAKKLYTVMALFYTNKFKASSTIHLEHNFINFNTVAEKGFSISRKGKRTVSRDLPIGEVKEFLNEDLKVTGYGFNDLLGYAQDKVSEFAEQHVEYAADVYNGSAEYEFVDENGNLVIESAEIGFSDETIALLPTPSKSDKDFKRVLDVYYYVRRRYDKITSFRVNAIKALDEKKDTISDYKYNKEKEAINAAYESAKFELSNFTRNMFKDTDVVEAGRLMFAASILKKDGGDFSYNPSSSNLCYLRIAHEFGVAFVTEAFGEVKVEGYPLLGDFKTINLIEEFNIGETFEFKNGSCLTMEGVYVDSDFTGELRIEMIDNMLYAVRDIEHKRLPFTPIEHFDVLFMKHSVKDPSKYVLENKIVDNRSFQVLLSRNLDNPIGTGLLRKAKSIKVVPYNKNFKTSKGIMYNALTATVTKVATGNEVDVPFAQYVGHSDLIESMIIGLVSTGVDINPVELDGESHDSILMLDQGIGILRLKYKDQERIAVEPNHTATSSATEDVSFEDIFGCQSRVITDKDIYTVDNKVSQGGNGVFAPKNNEFESELESEFDIDNQFDFSDCDFSIFGLQE